MHYLPRCFLTCLVALIAGCSSPDSRIADNKAAFESLPPATQAKIRAGEVEVGYTPAMVIMALGEPAHRFTRKSEVGDTEVWSYVSDRPRFSIGVGVGSGGHHSSVGGGVGISTGGRDPDEKARVEFRNGAVTAIDIFQKK